VCNLHQQCRCSNNQELPQTMWSIRGLWRLHGNLITVEYRLHGKLITVEYRNVQTYINNGTQLLDITFNFDTGVQDTSTNSWNVQGTITARFSKYAAKAKISVSAGVGGGSSSTTSNHSAHILKYKCPPRHKIVLKQKVLISGEFQYRSFDLGNRYWCS